jgi:hypothetical protein
MPAQYEVHGRTQFPYSDVSSSLSNLRLNVNIPKLIFIPTNHTLVAHDPAYPGPHAQDLVPCADGVGEIESVGEGSSWKIRQRVLFSLGDWIDWGYNGDDEFPALQTFRA